MKLNCYTTDTCSPATSRRQPSAEAWLASSFAGVPALHPLYQLLRSQSAGGPRIPVEVVSNETSYTASLELPGVKKDAVQIQLAERELTIKAERKTGQGDTERVSTLTRTLLLPDDVQEDNIQAALEDGVLTLTLPKQAPVTPRSIAIN